MPNRQIHHFLFSVIIVQSMLRICVSDRLQDKQEAMHSIAFEEIRRATMYLSM